MSEPTLNAARAAMTEVIVCTTCRPAGASREQPAAGEALFDAVQVAAWELDAVQRGSLRIRGVACMTGCNRACTVTFQALGKYTYYFGDLAAEAETASQILACAQLHADTADGALQRNDRPERLRNGLLARLPPLGTSALPQG